MIDLSKFNVVDFTVVSNDDKSDFEHEVSLRIDEGFLPYGLMIIDSKGTFHIPMIKVVKRAKWW